MAITYSESSAYQTNYSENAWDGDTATYWQTNSAWSDYGGQWCEKDFGEPVEVTAARAYNDGSSITHALQYHNGSSWIAVDSFKHDATGWLELTMASPITAQRWRVIALGGLPGAWTLLREMELTLAASATVTVECGDTLLKYLQDQGATSKEIVGALNELNATSGVEFQQAYDTYFNS